MRRRLAGHRGIHALNACGFIADTPRVPSRERESSFQGLVEAGIALSSEFTLEGLLQRLVETAAELTGARFAALGVIDVTGASSSGSSRTGSTRRGTRRSATFRVVAGSSAS